MRNPGTQLVIGSFVCFVTATACSDNGNSLGTRVTSHQTGGSGAAAAGGSAHSGGNSNTGGTTGNVLPTGGVANTGGTLGTGGDLVGLGGTQTTGGATGSTAVCDAQPCASNQLCVHPGCGSGVPPACSALNDAGACPSGWTYSSSCYNLPAAGPGCLPPACVPPPAFCVDIPAGCGSPITCSCLPPNICTGDGGCGLIENGTDVVCVAA
jgi:hypothetical protein